MNNGNELNLTDGWEDIVNNGKRHNARDRLDAKIARRKRVQVINKSIDCVLGAVTCMAFDAADLLVNWLAIPAAVVLLGAACVIAGRAYEQCRRER